MSSIRKLSLRAFKSPLIMAAPMNGGINNPAFAAAVINQGGVAGFGFTYHTPQAICKDISDTRALSSGPINANFFVFDTLNAPTSKALTLAASALKQRLSVDDKLIKTPANPYTPDLSVQIEAIWHMRPEILTFHFGIPEKEYIAEASRLGISTGVTATSVQEAQQIQESGADFIIAQGIEAGGHRGMFNSTWAQIAAGTSEGIDEQLSTMALVSRLAHPSSGTTIPVIAAGGIMTGHDIYRVTQAGAVGVQMGTAFLPCTESTASAAHKRYILHHASRGCAYTKAFSGRPAQGIRNEFMDTMVTVPMLDFPLQNTLTSLIRSDAVRRDDGERQSLWAGSNVARAADRIVTSDGNALNNTSNNRSSGVKMGLQSEQSVVQNSRASGSVANEVRYLSAGELMQQLRSEYTAAVEAASGDCI